MVTVVAQFDITYTQFLDSHGELTEQLPDFVSDTSTLVELYKNMAQVRAYDQKAIALQRTGKMGTYAPINGQEAISTAIGHAMKKDDVLVPYYRDYGAQLLRGVKMSEIYAYWGGDERGSQFECNSEDLPICVPIASQCLHAAGVAFAFKYKKQQRVAVGCIGDGGTSEGDFYEAINVAGAWNLPVVFVVNSNFWAISVPRDMQTAAKTIAQKAIAAGIKGLQVDGNDIIAMRHEIGLAIERARNGKGPTVIEALTYRLCDHTTADDASRYQPQDEVTTAQSKEPLSRLKLYLSNQNCWDDEKEKALQLEIAANVQHAVDEYTTRTPQKVSDIFDYHFATLPDYLIEQRAMALEDE
jgi:2-oxoisovalerate dehydrogenase E1 component subunit alpha